MMTLNQAERLVRKIAEAGSQPASDTQTAKLAQDYAEVCRASNRRLAGLLPGPPIALAGAILRQIHSPAQ